MRKITLVASFVAGAALVLFGAGAASATVGDSPVTIAITTGSLVSSEPASAAGLSGVPDSRDF
jgi:hypothetical protein